MRGRRSVKRSLLLALCGVLKKLRQRVADGCERVRVVRIRWTSFPFEMRPIAERPSPFDIRLTHEILQDRLRIEDLVDIAGQDNGRLIEILDEDFARPHVAHHHLRQDASGIIEMRSEIVGDGGLGLLDGWNR